MPSRFDEDSAVYNEELLYHQGEQVTLHPGGDVARVVDALVAKEQVVERVQDDGIVQVRTRMVKVRTADAGEPTAGALAAIGGVQYHVEAQSAPAGGLVTLNLVRHDITERSKPQYRT